MNTMVVMQTFVLHYTGLALDSASLRFFGEVYKIISSHLFARGASYSSKMHRRNIIPGKCLCEMI